MDDRLRKQLDFALEIDKEKNIFRQTHLSGHGRNENDAEHAWHMAIMAYLLREYSNEKVDIAKVMLMCLIHDIVEIDAGDTYAYDTEGLATQRREKMPQRSESSPCFPLTRRQNLYLYLTSLRNSAQQNRSLPTQWTTSSQLSLITATAARTGKSIMLLQRQSTVAITRPSLAQKSSLP